MKYIKSFSIDAEDPVVEIAEPNHITLTPTASDGWGSKWYRLNRSRKDVLEQQEEGEFDLFSRTLFPPAKDDRVLACGAAAVNELLGQRAIQYDRDTACLETEVVIPELLYFHSYEYGNLDRSLLLREDAALAIADEGLHTATAARVENFVRSVGICPIRASRAHFLETLDQALDGRSEPERELIRFAFCFTTETLISGTLRTLPHDQRVHPVLREEVRQHAIDEGRHQILYGKRFVRAWPTFTTYERTLLCWHIPKFIHSFLTPDLGLVLRLLVHIGLDDVTSREIIADSYPEQLNLTSAAVDCLRYCAQAGVFHDTEAIKCFQASSLLF